MIFRSVRNAALALSITTSLFATACIDPGSTDYRPDDGPGSDIWGSDDVGCSNDGDCAASESCINQVCQVSRCGAGPYTSLSPIGSNHYFKLDRELTVTDTTIASGAYWTDGYAHSEGGVGYATSWSFGSSAPVDAAGGNVKGFRPEQTVIAVAGDTRVKIVSSAGSESFDVGLQPVAIAAGDVDADGIDEVIALAADGELAVCRIPAASCAYSNFGAGYTGIDVAAGDVDGDGLAEAIVLLGNGAYSFVIAVNSHPGPNEPNSVGGTATDSLLRIGAGDLDGDGVDEAIGLHDAGCGTFSCGSDSVVVYSLKGSLVEKSRTTVGDKILDLSVSKLLVTAEAKVVLLEEAKVVRILSGTGASALTTEYSATLGTTATPGRITSVDFDGDSPAAKLMSGPTPLPGPIVPTMALQFPPYYRYRSNGKSSLFIGQGQSQSNDVSDTVSLNMGIDVAVSQDFAGLFSARISESLSRSVSRTTSRSSSLSKGAHYAVSPDPETYGTKYGAVVISYGCFHGYTYEMDDPANKLGGSGGKFMLLVPVDARLSLWSTTRYNAMADALGNIPMIPIPYTVGDPASYPDTFKDLHGANVQSADLVFPDPLHYQVSDVGEVGFDLSVSESATQSESMSIDVGLAGSIGVGGFTVGASLGQGWGKGISLNLGESASFSGGVPAVPDDASTPGDEYAEFAYGFTPVVYRQHYTSEAGQDAAFYVLTFTTEM